MASGDTRELVGVQRRSVGAQQDDAIAALLRVPEVEAAAVAAGVSTGTLREWLRSPQFRAKYRAARQEGIEDAVARLEHLVGSAVEALARNLVCGDPAVEVEAARVILERVGAAADPPLTGGSPDEQGSGRVGHASRNGHRGW
jgi:hypothetical protein